MYKCININYDILCRIDKSLIITLIIKIIFVQYNTSRRQWINTKLTSNTRLVARRIHSGAARVHSRVVRQTRARGPRAPLDFSFTSKRSPSRRACVSLAYVWDRTTNWNILAYRSILHDFNRLIEYKTDGQDVQVAAK